MEKKHNSIIKPFAWVIGNFILLCLFFIFYRLSGNTEYLLKYRIGILITVFVVSLCHGFSTILFQTLTYNRILSPSMIGLEHLFILIQTGFLFFLGVNEFILIDSILLFLVQVGIMMIFVFLLFSLFFKTSIILNLYKLLLIGIICGYFFDSLSSFLQRMLNPTDFTILQSSFYASLKVFVPRNFLVLVVVLSLVVGGFLIKESKHINILFLGRNRAIALGFRYSLKVYIYLMCIALLITISTALVGPLAFFGFVVAHFSYRFMPGFNHTLLFLFAFFFGSCILLGSEIILNSLFKVGVPLSVLINFFGGIVFLMTLLKTQKPLVF